ncbi:flagellar biosynthetic protein FliR [Pacificimonas flava]|uniref:Flagellar biosynthetic protein FliR n=1 Tax=Pacificimonas flava TaxID=1234595 RepID=M2TC34_9SPHN|nr:flagellar biosynthetic protein FliR [Pacificimonas flava]EMD84189.1 Flagellar biosynthesis protein FliR [Pacificimonas flava]MBB5279933.1 flagellar biosynthetic protein FliR [Pacificimonas flava]
MTQILGLDVEAQFVALLFAMLRIGGAFLVAPVFSALGLPIIVRVSLSAAIGFIVIGAAGVTPPADPLSLVALAAAVQEVMLGLAMGFVLQVAFAAPLLAGDYIANSMGLGFASMMNPQMGVNSPVLAQFLMIFTVLLFLGMDGHLILLRALVDSYEVLPIAGDWLTASLGQNIALFGAIMFRAGLMIALPVGFALFAVNIVVGVMTRSAPQLNIFAVGLPLTLMIGTALLALLFPGMTALFEDVIEEGLTMVTDISEGRF